MSQSTAGLQCLAPPERIGARTRADSTGHADMNPSYPPVFCAKNGTWPMTDGQVTWASIMWVSIPKQSSCHRYDSSRTSTRYNTAAHGVTSNRSSRNLAADDPSETDRFQTDLSSSEHPQSAGTQVEDFLQSNFLATSSPSAELQFARGWSVDALTGRERDSEAAGNSDDEAAARATPTRRI